MRQFIYNNYRLLIIVFIAGAVICIYIINNYQTGFLGGLITGFASAIPIGLLVTPKEKFINLEK